MNDKVNFTKLTRNINKEIPNVYNMEHLPFFYFLAMRLNFIWLINFN